MLSWVRTHALHAAKVQLCRQLKLGTSRTHSLSHSAHDGKIPRLHCIAKIELDPGETRPRLLHRKMMLVVCLLLGKQLPGCSNIDEK